MLSVLFLLTVAGLLAVSVAVAAVVALARAAGPGAVAGAVASGLLFILGAVPPSVLGVLWYARTADYRWAIRGPGPFAHLGGGPAMLAALTLVTVWTAGCWAAAIWLSARVVRGATQASSQDAV